MSMEVNFSVTHTSVDDTTTGREDRTLNVSRARLNDSSTPPATKAWSGRRTLTAGADALDLAALPDGQNWTGLRLQTIEIEVITASDPVVFTKAGSNGYFLWGDTGGSQTLIQGGHIAKKTNDGVPDVGGTAKAIAITSADQDAIYDIHITAG